MLGPTGQSSDAVRVIVEFCRFAREKGLSVGVQETLGALDAAAALGVRSEELKFGLRSILCGSKDDWDLFEECFQMFWRESAVEPQSSHRRPPRKEISSRVSERNPASLMSMGAGEDVSSEEDGAQTVTGASAHERLTKADFPAVPLSDLATLEQISIRLFKQMSRRLARKRRTGSRGQVDLRKTIRRSISHGGEPMNLRYRERKPRPHRLVTLLDISGSMSPYSLFLVKFLYTLQKHFRRVDTFLFSTGLVEITSLFRAQRLQDALQALSQRPAGWSGGTSIGGSLREFNQIHRRKLRSSDTLFVILSDGWDTGDAGVLAAELGAVKRRVRRIIWLNPLLGLKEYQPITSGMSAALPHIDLFAPCHNLESLLALEKHL
ncbi:MAG TPA: VWA domain-containing protein [Terriglobales bacterium]|nr:VWA domain-containing protein [Terriglobales bacterium]